MNQERDKFLTEAMGYEWFVGAHCYVHPDTPVFSKTLSKPVDFSTWEGFGKLWEWMRKQVWGTDFWYFTTVFDQHGTELAWPRDASIINPDNFANTLYAYLLKENA
jgi:hypothetical protein